MKIISKKHFLLLLSLYITQFLGLGFFTEAFISILRKSGLSLENVGLIYMLGLFWVLRFIWAPIVDKINIRKIGHYKFWLLLAQFIMFFSLLISSYFDINTQIQYIVIFALIFSFFSATQDIALDALVYKTLTKEQRTLGNAIKVSGGLIGTILGGGVALMIYSYIGWQNTLFILAVVTSISILQLLFFKEISQEKEVKKKVAVFKEFYSFWHTKNRKIWFIFIFLFPSAIASAHGLIAPILVDSKWELKDIGFIVHIVGYSIGILASFGTSFLVNRFGRINILILSAFGQIVSVLLLLIILSGYTNIYIVTLIVGLIYLFYTPTATIISTLMMDEIDSENPASQYAIQHSIFMFSIIVFASLSVYFSGKLGYENIILIVSCIAIIPLILSFKIQKYLKK
ncbi:MFS transporter [Arcobacter sp. FW59]|nr:MFS transporter [Arcobacter sp. FW59]